MSGGSSICSNPDWYSDVYGKFSSNWTSNGTSSGAQLEPWLDPIGININSLDGTYSPCGGNSLNCIIGLYTDTINEGELIDFFGGSNSNSASWSWNLDVNGIGGVSPSTSSIKILQQYCIQIQVHLMFYSLYLVDKVHV